MKRVTVALDERLYRYAKAYSKAEDLSLSAAIVRLLERVAGPGVGVAGARGEELGPGCYRDELTGLVVSRGGGILGEELARAGVVGEGGASAGEGRGG